jgi:hypothetical protein
VTTSPYRQPGACDQRAVVIAEARRVRDALATSPRFHNIGGGLSSSQEIVDALNGCLHELMSSTDDEPGVPF